MDAMAGTAPLQLESALQLLRQRCNESWFSVHASSARAVAKETIFDCIEEFLRHGRLPLRTSEQQGISHQLAKGGA